MILIKSILGNILGLLVIYGKYTKFHSREDSTEVIQFFMVWCKEPKEISSGLLGENWSLENHG